MDVGGAPEAKTEARDRAVAAIRQGGFGPREVVVRINGLVPTCLAG